MNLNYKTNEAKICGTIGHIQLKDGRHGVYGTISVYVDDSYTDTANREKVKRDHLVKVAVDKRVLEQFNTEPSKGDLLWIKGKLVIDESFQLHFRGQRVIQHATRGELAALHAAGFQTKKTPVKQQAPQLNQSAATNTAPQTPPHANEGHTTTTHAQEAAMPAAQKAWLGAQS